MMKLYHELTLLAFGTLSILLPVSADVNYCKFMGQITNPGGTTVARFMPDVYSTSNGEPPSVNDAIRPDKKFLAYTGDCKYIVDSACTVKASDLKCSNCCYYLTSNVVLNGVTCFNDLTQVCSYNFVPLSGFCGQPPSTTLCNICTNG